MGRTRHTHVLVAAGLLLLAACGSSSADTSAPSSTAGSSSTITAPASSTSTTSAPAVTATTARSADRATAARDVAATFVGRLRDGAAKGDYASAAALWSGYPDDESTRTATLKTVVAGNRWLLDGAVNLDVVDAWSFTDPPQVVSVVDANHRGALALLIDGTGTIQRIQTAEQVGGTIRLNGSTVTVPGVPVEGGAAAYYDGRRLSDDAVQPEPDANVTRIRLPAPPDPVNPRLLTVSMATPELPSALAVLVGGPLPSPAKG